MYEINNIKEIDHGDVAAKELAHKNQSLESIVTDKGDKSSEKQKFSLKDLLEKGFFVCE